MIFLVSRASIDVPHEYTDGEDSLEKYHNTKPCDEAFYITIKHRINPYDCSDENLEVKRWAIEINTLEELLEFRKKYDTGNFYGEIDIEKLSSKDDECNVQDDYLRLVIHDEYRE
mgnify:CR=1 FL=1|jgi:hypothetical protein